MKYTIIPKALEGDACEVLNYRRKPQIWERGTVIEVDVRLYGDGTNSVAYRVRLDRTTKKSWGWPKQFRDVPLFLSVGGDAIRKINGQ